MSKRERSSGAAVSAPRSRPQGGKRSGRPAAAAPLSRGSLWRQLGLCVIAGVLIFMSFPFTTVPDSNWWPLGWIGLVPFLWALRDEIRPRRAFWLGALTGLVTNFGGFWWISEVVRDFGHLPGFVAWPVSALNAGYQGLMFALFAWFYVRFRPKRRGANIFAIAALFTFIEFVYPLIFPWYLGNGQYRFIPIIQIADVTGVMGLTFTMVLFNAALLRVAEWRIARVRLPLRQVLGAAAVTLGVLAYGLIRVGQVDATSEAAEKLNLGLVEADIGIWEKEAKGMGRAEQAMTLHKNLLLHQEMSRDLARRGADLIVWPESSYFPLDDPFVKRQDRFALGLGEDGALLAWRHQPDAGFRWSIDTPHLLADAGSPPGARLRALAAEREDAWVAVGDAGRAAIGDARTVRPLASGTTAALRSVAVVSMPGFRAHADGGEVSIWAVGDAGTVVTGHGDGLAPAASPVTTRLNGVAMSTGREGVAVGDGGVVVAIAGGDLARVDVGTTRDLFAVWAQRGGATAVAVGQGGVTVVRAGGRGWVVEQAPFDRTLRHVVGTEDGRVIYAAGAGGAMLRRAGGRWAAETFPSSEDVVALGLDARETPLAADASGGLFRRDPQGGWQRLDAPGLGVVEAIAPLPYVEVLPLPRDVRYVWQGRAPLPDLAAFVADPAIEFGGVSTADLSAVQRGFTTPVLFGGITWEPAVDGSTHRVRYNTAIMLDDVGRVVGTYDKVYLLAFGEYIPFGDIFPSLYDMLPESGRFAPGREVRAFQWGNRRVGVMICYEDILAKFTGKLADKDPNIIINVTNDAWFGHTSEPYLHLALSVFRAVENRLVLARATNTGVSAVIDPVGRIVAQTRLTDAETTLETVPLMSGETIYGKVGDLFSWLLALALVAYGVLVRRRERATQHRGESA
ncbi:MAG: apolipoprotein N-acyltransferase [Deltaproteobacteria bacterium HGW-Deltaproteobacteria-14]|jgi:apolipoprotein N-acyltransferase|nr:MAG: apolipoprotein N-acyltransferase [Deltaproteobacteria bacterium HGW-Deltaproteobacteria-14]